MTQEGLKPIFKKKKYNSYFKNLYENKSKLNCDNTDDLYLKLKKIICNSEHRNSTESI